MHFLFLFGLFIVIPAFFDWCLIRDCPNMWVPLLTLIPCLTILAYNEYKSSQEKKKAQARVATVEAIKKATQEQNDVKNKRFVIEEEK